MSLLIAHTIALATLAVIAIGLISYNIIKNKKRRIPNRERYIEYVDIYESELSLDHLGVRKRHHANTEIKKPSCEKSESTKESSTHSSRKFPDVSPRSSVEKEGLVNNLDSLNQYKNEINKIQNTNQNIYLKDSKKVDVAKSVVDEDAESSVSNGSVSNANDFTSESNSLESLKSERSSEEKTFEKLYKKEVCECLKNEVETMSITSITDSNLSEEDDLCNLRDFDNAVENTVICKGCEESYANAIAYPCGHKYLCLDCAIKVHRIHKKCAVCNFHIDTYDILN